MSSKWIYGIGVSAAIAALLGLGGCTDNSGKFRLSKNVPDEFAIVTHPALTVPPHIAMRPGEESREKVTPFATPSHGEAKPLSKGEVRLLEHAQTQPVTPETKQLMQEGKPRYTFPWQKNKAENTPLDPYKEAERLHPKEKPVSTPPASAK